MYKRLCTGYIHTLSGYLQPIYTHTHSHIHSHGHKRANGVDGRWDLVFTVHGRVLRPDSSRYKRSSLPPAHSSQGGPPRMPTWVKIAVF